MYIHRQPRNARCDACIIIIIIMHTSHRAFLVCLWYIETSKQQQGFPCKNSHPKCFKTTNFDRFHRQYIKQYLTIYIDVSVGASVMFWIPLCFHLGINYLFLSRSMIPPLKPVFHLANLFARTDKKVGTLPTCSRRIFSPANFNQSRCRILVFASRRANKFA